MGEAPDIHPNAVDGRRLVVDAMNVIGSRPTGWWRDRRGAMAAFVAELDRYAQATGAQVTAVLDSRPFELDAGGIDVRFAAPGRDAADDAIVALLAAEADPASLVVVTSDRGLAARVREAGAGVMAAGELRRALDDAAGGTLPGDMDDTEELRHEQEQRAAEEERRAREAESEPETKAHERRAEKSEYLREKLEERAESEREER